MLIYPYSIYSGCQWKHIDRNTRKCHSLCSCRRVYLYLPLFTGYRQIPSISSHQFVISRPNAEILAMPLHLVSPSHCLSLPISSVIPTGPLALTKIPAATENRVWLRQMQYLRQCVNPDRGKLRTPSWHAPILSRYNYNILVLALPLHYHRKSSGRSWLSIVKDKVRHDKAVTL